VKVLTMYAPRLALVLGFRFPGIEDVQPSTASPLTVRTTGTMRSRHPSSH
jgi:hypothetical protein